MKTLKSKWIGFLTNEMCEMFHIKGCLYKMADETLMKHFYPALLNKPVQGMAPTECPHSACLLAYLLACLLTCLLTYLLACLLACLLVFLLTCLP